MELTKEEAKILLDALRPTIVNIIMTSPMSYTKLLAENNENREYNYNYLILEARLYSFYMDDSGCVQRAIEFLSQFYNPKSSTTPTVVNENDPKYRLDPDQLDYLHKIVGRKI